MRAIILAGGRGQRLMPLTDGRPKPLVPFLDRPILDYTLAQLGAAGFTDVVITLGYEGARIRAHVGDGSRWGVRVGYSQEETALGTAGAVRLALARFPAREPVLIVSGDGLTDFDLAGFYRRMRAARAEAGLLVAAVADPRAYGVVELAGDGQVVGFVEKPAWLMEGAVVNTGIYYLEPGLLAGVPVGVPVDFGHELFPQWIAEGRRVRGEAGRGYWCDVGTVEQYRAAHEAALDGRVRLPWPVAVTVGRGARGRCIWGRGRSWSRRRRWGRTR
ncbi:putative Glucose-1-phosphate thymidylyltransferase [Candidatus Hydrogenisulfobacillus filiaventi]|uniref:Putative Glucose-1-phosphate thymidylyltransferase n=1 Tax=Candidatus Hydrogenisulfobacillus filiaventi TaxID=2707344 RepID=A0A6F8ZCH6_9FIRM|nr:putative Glucose-1-phosphate thymidylyltransferase [Candidatus Hydrogenisulfobacillus filiaventi]